jgi:hypothetical protein
MVLVFLTAKWATIIKKNTFCTLISFYCKSSWLDLCWASSQIYRSAAYVLHLIYYTLVPKYKQYRTLVQLSWRLHPWRCFLNWCLSFFWMMSPSKSHLTPQITATGTEQWKFKQVNSFLHVQNLQRKSDSWQELQCLRLPPFCALFCSHLSYVISPNMHVVSEGYYVMFTVSIPVKWTEMWRGSVYETSFFSRSIITCVIIFLRAWTQTS